MTREEVFVPNTRGSLLKTPIGGMELEELVEDTPAFRLLALIGQQVRLLIISIHTGAHVLIYQKLEDVWLAALPVNECDRTTHFACWNESFVGPLLHPFCLVLTFFLSTDFNPSSPLFQPRQKPQIILSDTALIFVFGLLYILKSHIGWIGLTKYYIIPYFMVNHWLVMVSPFHIQLYRCSKPLLVLDCVPSSWFSFPAPSLCRSEHVL